ncbi:MAG TPA: hypothetical protein VFQ79_06935 [Bryobacteraceae bacterium]|nr:hypothetical protein [Bryobacteraceae bacterium]
MKLQQADGFPLTFNLPDAAAMTGARVPALRTYIARNILNHVGQFPLAGQERRFTVTGLVEVGIVDALAESLSLAAASKVADYGLEAAFSVARLCGADSHENFDQKPELWMNGPQWDHRDLANPVFWAFVLNENNNVAGFDVAFGWSDIGRACKDVAKQTFRVTLPSVPWGGPATQVSSLPQPSEEFIGTATPHVHVLNLTAILTKIDRAISEKQGTAS